MFGVEWSVTCHMSHDPCKNIQHTNINYHIINIPMAFAVAMYQCPMYQ